MLLTIVTLGICSVWAKVRRNRYFYRLWPGSPCLSRSGSQHRLVIP
ncbi:DUF898 family protein [Rhizobium gallicum]